MAINLNELVRPFHDRLDTLLEACMARGVEMRPYAALRHPREQARLWRQSRTEDEARVAAALLQDRGAPFLARCLEEAQADTGKLGKHVTNALPGFSWHQWGEAVDCYWHVHDTANWDIYLMINGVNGYRVYTDQALDLGLTPGGSWQDPDWVHVQLRGQNNPMGMMSFEEIDQAMRWRFGA